MTASMAAIIIGSVLSPPSLLLSSSPRPRISCSRSSSPSPIMESQAGDGRGFMDFPYVSAPHKDLMVDLVSTVQTRLDPFLLPCNLPPDVRSYHNQSGTAHASLHVRSGLPSSQSSLDGDGLMADIASAAPRDPRIKQKMK